MEGLNFEIVDDKSTLSELNTEWRESLTFPNDDFDEYQLDISQYWALNVKEKLVGYACVSEKNTLLQFYITAQYLNYGQQLLEEFIKYKEINKGIICTNNPITLSMVMHFQKSIEISGYMFNDTIDYKQEEKEGDFEIAQLKDLEELTIFSHEVLQASKDWLRKYIANWIKRGEFFILKKQNEIVGTLEVRTSDLNKQISCLGVVVSPKYRNQGYGIYLLGKGKNISKAKNKTPICSCSKENISSKKAIEKSGFRVLHLSLVVNF